MDGWIEKCPRLNQLFKHQYRPFHIFSQSEWNLVLHVYIIRFLWKFHETHFRSPHSSSYTYYTCIHAYKASYIALISHKTIEWWVMVAGSSSKLLKFIYFLRFSPVKWCFFRLFFFSPLLLIGCRWLMLLNWNIRSLNRIFVYALHFQSN